MDLFKVPYSKVLILGAIAAASAFVVTILIVLVCVGCQRKSKSKHAQAIGGKVDTGLRQSKLNPISKSDTRLHEMHRLPCSANGVPKTRPASMDLLLLHSRRSTPDLRLAPHPTTGPDDRDHTYSEVGRRSTPALPCPDDGLYESVGMRRPPPEPGALPPPPPQAPALAPAPGPDTPPPPPVQCHSQGPATEGNGRGGGGGGGVRGGGGGGNEAGQDAVTAEYATIRKVRKLERGKRENGSEEGEREEHSVSSGESSTSTLHRKTLEPFHMPNFPKEAVFMGNGEQYIWKPPEENDAVAGAPLTENGHSHATAAEISEMYSTVCKTLKKKQQQKPGSSQPGSGQTASAPSSLDGEEGGGPPGGAPEEEKEARRCASEDHCYDTVGEKKWPRSVESDPAYATIDSLRKRERPASNTLKPQKKPPGVQGPGRAMTCENFYESIGDVKGLAENATSTTTIFTFSDGMEMYVTGL